MTILLPTVPVISASPSAPPPSRLVISYLTLRKTVGWLGLSLVPILVIGTSITEGHFNIRISASSYYYSAMRNEMIGIICGISMFLIAYRGYCTQDSLASKLAGIFALGIAFFPTSSSNDKTDLVSIIHYMSAALFFITLSIISIVLFTKSTAVEFTKQKKERNQVYRLCGFIMLVSISFIGMDNIQVLDRNLPFLKLTILYETIALSAFGFSWLIKGEFILKDK